MTYTELSPAAHELTEIKASAILRMVLRQALKRRRIEIDDFTVTPSGNVTCHVVTNAKWRTVRDWFTGAGANVQHFDCEAVGRFYVVFRVEG